MRFDADRLWRGEYVVTIKITTAATLLALALRIVACAQSLRVDDYDEAFVTKTVKPGMTRPELYSYFGQPVTENKASDGSPVLFYFKHTKRDGAQDIFWRIRGVPKQRQGAGLACDPNQRFQATLGRELDSGERLRRADD
jgi:outer membrane protein assembly factor BamE (lipoprotein component of BamABCDE complex)